MIHLRRTRAAAMVNGDFGWFPLSTNSILQVKHFLGFQRADHCAKDWIKSTAGKIRK